MVQILVVLLVIIAIVVVLAIKNKSKESGYPFSYKRTPTVDEYEPFLASFESKEFLSYTELTNFLSEYNDKIQYLSINSTFRAKFNSVIQEKKNKLAEKK